MTVEGSGEPSRASWNKMAATAGWLSSARPASVGTKQNTILQLSLSQQPANNHSRNITSPSLLYIFKNRINFFNPRVFSPCIFPQFTLFTTTRLSPDFWISQRLRRFRQPTAACSESALDRVGPRLSLVGSQVVTEYRQHTTALAIHMVSFLAGLETIWSSLVPIE